VTNTVDMAACRGRVISQELRELAEIQSVSPLRTLVTDTSALRVSEHRERGLLSSKR
jgi:hypothetical protein